MDKMYSGKKALLLMIFVLILFLLAIGLCCRYALRNQELQDEISDLSAELADRNREVENIAREQERLKDMFALREQQAEDTAMEERRPETGFIKKDNVYLIDMAFQLKKLQQLIIDGAEIEPGLPAAEASYRLRASLEMEDWFFLGTEEAPFRGNFDGDNHSLSGNFPLRSGENVPEALFRTGPEAKIANLQVNNRMYDSVDREISFVLYDYRECAELEGYLADFPECPVRVELYAWDPDIRGTADALRERWERNQEREGYSVSISYYPYSGEKPDREIYEQNILTPLCGLAGEEYRELIEEALDREGGYLRFVKLERIGGITCCSFETGELEDGYHRDGEGYHLTLDGQWEGKEIHRQHLFIPYTEMEMCSLGTNRDYRVEMVDLDFDGKQDLLIHEGFSGGSGGSWSNYRAAVWKEDGQFVWYPSFPEQLVSLEFDSQRVVDRGRVGAGYEFVRVYGVVNGEYVCTRELICQTVYREGGQGAVHELSYYEMGELIQTHILSDEDERKELYPDMDYWFIG